MNTFIKKSQAGISKFRSLLPIYGFWGSVGQILHNRILIQATYRFEKDLRTPYPKLAVKIPLEITPLKGEVDLDQWGIRQEILKIRGVEQFQDRLANGDILFCACSEGKLAGFIWLKGFPVKGAGYKLKDDEAYYFDGWTFEPYRGKGIFSALQQAVFDYVRAHYPKIRILTGHASAWNKPSIIGQQRAGLVLVARDLSIVFLGQYRKFRLKTIQKPT